MSKLTIRNYAAPQWTSVLESRARLGLGSILANSRRVEIELREGAPTNTTFTCSLSVILTNGDKHKLTNTQPKAGIAIDGVIARTRRAVNRQGLLRAGTVNALLSGAAADSALLR